MRYGVQRRFDENICVIVQQFYMKQSVHKYSSSIYIYKLNVKPMNNVLDY